MNLQYNTQQSGVMLKEYGRNLQNLANYVSKVEDKDERTRLAHHLIALMREINPETRESEDVEKKLWDDLYIMSGFKLDVESPFPMPETASIGKKPQKLALKRTEVKLRYYGRNIELLVQKAFQVEDIDEKVTHIGYIGRLMKSFYSSWNKEGITNDIVLEHLEVMTGQKVSQELKDKLAEEKSFDVIPREKSQRYDNNREKRSNIPTKKPRTNQSGFVSNNSSTNINNNTGRNNTKRDANTNNNPKDNSRRPQRRK